MSRFYNNINSGLRVASGKIDSIAEDKKSFNIKYTKWSKHKDGVSSSSEEIVQCFNRDGNTFDDIEVGQEVCAYGYGRGEGNIYLEGLLKGNQNHYVEIDTKLAILYGRIKDACLNNEKDAEGKPKLKADGITARKPHFDIKMTIRKKDDNGDVYYESHTVRKYRFAKDSQDALEIFGKKFKDFNKEEKNYLVCVVTGPAEVSPFTFTNKDGEEITMYTATHMGINSVDTEIVDPLPKWEDRSNNNASGTTSSQNTETQTTTPTAESRPSTVSEAAAEDDEPDID
jgi:hypothetical protein